MKNIKIDQKTKRVSDTNRFLGSIGVRPIRIFEFILAVMGVVSCGGSNKTGEVEGSQAGASDTLYLDEAQQRNAGIEVAEVHKEWVNTEVNLLGRVVSSPEGEVVVSSVVGGLVKRIAVKPGDLVKKGDLLCEIENLQVVDWQESFLIAESEGAVLKSEYERQREMYASKASSLKALQLAESSFKANQARKAGLIQRLMAVGMTPERVRAGIQSRLAIKAPVSSTVISVDAHLGMNVADNAGMMKLAMEGAGMWVLTGYEGQTSLVKVGMGVELSPAEGGADNVVPGKVVALSPVIENDRSWKVYCKPNASTKAENGGAFTSVKIGQAVKGKLVLSAIESPVLPDSAVFLRDGKNFCFVQIGSNNPKMKAYALTPIVVVGRQKNQVVLSQSPKGNVVVGGAYSLWMMWDASRNAEE